MKQKLVVGYIPEHFSTPLFLAEIHGFYEKRSIEVEFKAFPSGSGHLIQSLGDGTINMAVGLTEAFIRARAAGTDYYRLIGTYVQSPLCWAVSTGYDRDDIKSMDELEGKICGVSRMGSGSDVMSRVLQLQKEWKTPFNYEVCDTFSNLRDAVNSSKTDFFMWEHFTSKKYYDNKEIKRIGEIYTPWPSWVVVAHTSLLETSVASKAVVNFVEGVNEGIKYFQSHLNEAIHYIEGHFDYSEADARAWLKTVKFSDNAGYVDPQVVENTINTLKSATNLPEACEKYDYITQLNDLDKN